MTLYYLLIFSPCMYRPYVDLAYYTTGFGTARQQFTAFIIWIPLQILAFLVYPVFKVSHDRSGTVNEVMCVLCRSGV